jgi:hypothetical protein
LWGLLQQNFYFDIEKIAVSYGATFSLFAAAHNVLIADSKKAPPRLAGHTLNHTKPKSLYKKSKY